MSGLWEHVYIHDLSLINILFADNGVDQLTADDGLTRTEFSRATP